MSPPFSSRIAQMISPSFPRRAAGQPDSVPDRTVTVYIDNQTQGAFDADGLANDFVGTGHFIVAESTGHDGFFANLQTRYSTKRFSFFLRNGTDLVLRELNPTQALSPASGLTSVPPMRMGITRSGQMYRPATFEEAQSWSASVAVSDPISAFIGNIDTRAGNEVQLWRGVQSLGIVNLLADIFPSSAPSP
ncbi:MAG: hypothetical protein U1F57_10160 [bacterium]